MMDPYAAYANPVDVTAIRMTARDATVATAEAFQLGEGPVWDAARNRLLWVDIVGRAVLSGELTGDRIVVQRRIDLGSMVGAVTVAADGGLLVAAQEELTMIRPDGTRAVGPRVVPAGERRRLNDGKTDPAGRFLVGSLALTGDSHREVLVRLEPDGHLTTLDDDLRLSNGLAWSTAGTRMFSVDTLRRAVFVRDYDPATGAVGPRQIHLTLDDGHPDGIAMDAADHLWIAVWGGAEIRRYDPAGRLVERIAVPAPHTSSVAFAGPDLDLLVITTAIDELSDERRRRFPDSGRLFTVRVDVPGAPVPVWSGVTATW
jgi:sugar lactone lactonase YvrE